MNLCQSCFWTYGHAPDCKAFEPRIELCYQPMNHMQTTAIDDRYAACQYQQTYRDIYPSEAYRQGMDLRLWVIVVIPLTVGFICGAALMWAMT